MPLHLPIVILAALAPIAIADAVPKFDIARECRFEGGSTAIFDHCAHDETDAQQRLQTEWPQFAGADRAACLMEATVGGEASYVDLLICLEMARDARNDKGVADDSLARTARRSTHPAQPGTSPVDRSD
jgi:hypothetical protein